MFLISGFYGQVQHPARFKYHKDNKTRNGREEKEKRVVNNDL